MSVAWQEGEDLLVAAQKKADSKPGFFGMFGNKGEPLPTRMTKKTEREGVGGESVVHKPSCGGTVAFGTNVPRSTPVRSQGILGGMWCLCVCSQRRSSASLPPLAVRKEEGREGGKGGG
jgi:hypothetical protein